MMSEGIIYPLNWEYLIFTSNKEVLFATLEEKFSHLKYTLEDSKKSKSSKYTSHSFNIMVNSQEERDEIFKILSQIEHVKFIL